jgi:hypothetical protein
VSFAKDDIKVVDKRGRVVLRAVEKENVPVIVNGTSAGAGVRSDVSKKSETIASPRSKRGPAIATPARASWSGVVGRTSHKVETVKSSTSQRGLQSKTSVNGKSSEHSELHAGRRPRSDLLCSRAAERPPDGAQDHRQRRMASSLQDQAQGFGAAPGAAAAQQRARTVRARASGLSANPPRRELGATRTSRRTAREERQAKRGQERKDAQCARSVSGGVAGNAQVHLARTSNVRQPPS